MKRILLIPGDGIGPEVMAEAKKLLGLLSQKWALSISCEEVDWGAERYLKDGIGLPQGALADIKARFDAILFGALGDPRIPDMAHGREILLGLRFGLNLFINLRPVKLWHPSLGVLKNNRAIDIVIFRENTEDIYLGLGSVTHQGSEQEITIDESKHSFHGVYRIINEAFSYAVRYNRKRVTLVDKANAIKFGGSLWQRVFRGVSKEYPSIKADHFFVDVAAMKMIQDPTQFEVVVTSNLFGDILSDLGAGLVGGLGICASGNINPSNIALFEPVHGSAPDIAGTNSANPIAMFLSVSMMMNYFGFMEFGSIIEKAIVDVLGRGATTKDLGGGLSCSEASHEVLRFIENY